MRYKPHRMVLPATPAAVARYHLNYGWENASIHGESSRLLNVNGNPCGNPVQRGYPSLYQGFPNDADTLLRWLGGGVYPAGWGVGDVYGAYLCDSASPLVDSLGLGPALPSNGANAITGREGVGLATSSFTAKVAAEITDATGDFIEAVSSAYGIVPAGEQRSLLIVVRVNPSSVTARTIVAMNGATNSWELIYDTTSFRVRTYTPGMLNTATPVGYSAGSWTWAALTFDATTKTQNILSEYGDGAGAVYGPNDLVNPGTARFSFGLSPASAMCQSAGFWWFKKILTPSMCAAFWRHAQAAGLSSAPVAYARANPLVCPITASRVACYGAGQVAVGYDANLVSAALGNGLGTGVVAEAGRTFLNIGTDNLAANIVDQGANTHTVIDGPTGMRDSIRVLQGGVWADIGGQSCYLFVGGVPIAGATAVPWSVGGMYKRATVGTRARASIVFSGDPAGNEGLNVLTDNLTPLDWARFVSNITPVGNAHNLLFFTHGSDNAPNDADFSSEDYVVQNCAVTPLAWRRVGTAAAAATGTPTCSLANPANIVYNPLVGEIRVKFSGFVGGAGATFLDYGSGAAGGLCLDVFGGTLRLRLWDSAGAVMTVVGGPIGTGYYDISVLWNSAAPLRGVAGAYIALIQNTAPLPTLLGFWPTPWTPSVNNITPLYTGTTAAGTGAARCLVEES